MEAILAGSIEPGTVLVIRYEGPKGGPGMREMLAITGALKGAGRGADCALVTDGRFSRRHVGLLHRPRRARGGRRRPHRLRRATATASWSTCRRQALDLLVDEAELGPPPGGVVAAAAPLHDAACSASTPGWSRAPRPAPSPTPSDQVRCEVLRRCLGFNNFC